MASNGRFSQVQAPIKVVHSNLDQEIIQVTEDKLRLVLNEHVAQIEDKKAWIAPLGVLLAVATAFSTSTFKDVLLKAATWEAIFLLTGIASFVWLLRTIYLALNAPTVEDVVEKIKNRATTP